MDFPVILPLSSQAGNATALARSLPAAFGFPGPRFPVPGGTPKHQAGGIET